MTCPIVGVAGTFRGSWRRISSRSACASCNRPLARYPAASASRMSARIGMTLRGEILERDFDIRHFTALGLEESLLQLDIR